MNRAERGEQLTEQVEEMIAELEDQLNEGYSEGFLEILDFYSRFKKYSLSNIMLIMRQRPDASLCAGFKTWEKQGYHVRKGEQAIWVRGPWLKKEIDPQTGEITERLIGYIPLPVFDRAQLTETVELPDMIDQLDGDYETQYQYARAALGTTGVLVVEDTLPSGVYGMSMNGKVIVSETLPSANKFVTLLHEWAHQALKHHERHTETTREQRELCAESASYLLARLFGLENSYSRDYILAFHGTIEGLHESLSEIHAAVKQIASLLEIAPKETQVAEAA